MPKNITGHFSDVARKVLCKHGGVIRFARKMLKVFFLEGFRGLKKRIPRLKHSLQSTNEQVSSSPNDFPQFYLPQFSDKILEMYGGQHLENAERFCAEQKGNVFDAFNGLDDDNLWNLLLLKEYGRYPHIRSLLPDWPSTELQRNWNGASGYRLSLQTLDFYKKVKNYYKTLGNRAIQQARVLDFGCGWGRIIRYFAKDVPNDSLFGCDPCDEILQACQSLRVPGTFRVSDFRPRELPFGEKFDLVYAYSVFTHLAEQTHQECLETLHNAMAKDGVLIVTFRSREFIDIRGGDLKKVSRKEINQLYDTFDRGEYAFQPHFREPIQGEITYGDTIIPQEYIQKKWTKLFTVAGVGLPQENSYQIPLLMKKR